MKAGRHPVAMLRPFTSQGPQGSGAHAMRMPMPGHALRIRAILFT